MGSFVFLHMNLRVRFSTYVPEGEVFHDSWMLFDLCFEFLECDDSIIVVVRGIKQNFCQFVQVVLSEWQGTFFHTRLENYFQFIPINGVRTYVLTNLSS